MGELIETIWGGLVGIVFAAILLVVSTWQLWVIVLLVMILNK